VIRLSAKFLPLNSRGSGFIETQNQAGIEELSQSPPTPPLQSADIHTHTGPNNDNLMLFSLITLHLRVMN
jgi:hypothetical protein